MSERKHSELGPSGSSRWLHCPGSVLATRGLPDSTNLAAAEGTAAHTLSEWCRLQKRKARSFLGEAITVEHVAFVVDENMADDVQLFVDYCEAEFGQAIVEARVEYTHWVPDGFGTADDIRIDDDVCIVTDLKYGVTDGEGAYGEPVSPVDNSQLKLYALGVLQTYGHLYDIRKFVLRICQPRLDYEEAWEITTLELMRWAEETVRPVVIDALLPGAPLRAGTWCTFCKARATCEVRAQASLKEIGADFQALDSLPAAIEQKTTAVASLSRETLGKILAASTAIKKYLKEVQAYAMNELKEGRGIGDWKLIESRANRVWAQDEANTVANLKVLGLTEEQIYSKKIISPPKAEAILGKKDRRLPNLYRKPTGKPKLSNDPTKQAMSVNALLEFKDIGDADTEE